MVFVDDTKYRLKTFFVTVEGFRQERIILLIKHRRQHSNMLCTVGALSYARSYRKGVRLSVCHSVTLYQKDAN